MPKICNLPAVGSCLSFSYPTDNRIHVPTRLRKRRFVVERIRDTHVHPISELARRRNPNLRRGQYLLTGHDLDCHDKRSFYIDSARRLAVDEPDLYRIALTDPVTGEPIDYHSMIFEGTQSDMAIAKTIIRQFNSKVASNPRIVFNAVIVRYDAEVTIPW